MRPDKTEQALGDLLDGIDFCEADGFYRATVHLGERDSVTVRAVPGASLSSVASIFIQAYNQFTQGETEADLLASLTRLLATDGEEGLWDGLSELVVAGVCRWSLEDMAATYGVEPPPLPPGDDRPAARVIVAGLPVTVLARIVIGVLWLAKNSVRSASAD